jgi:hypothetical protein
MAITLGLSGDLNGFGPQRKSGGRLLPSIRIPHPQMPSGTLRHSVSQDAQRKAPSHSSTRPRHPRHTWLVRDHLSDMCGRPAEGQGARGRPGMQHDDFRQIYHAVLADNPRRRAVRHHNDFRVKPIE